MYRSLGLPSGAVFEETQKWVLLEVKGEEVT